MSVRYVAKGIELEVSFWCLKTGTNRLGENPTENVGYQSLSLKFKTSFSTPRKNSELLNILVKEIAGLT